MELTCALCGSRTKPHCRGKNCPWVRCVACRAMAFLKEGLPVWRRI